jgi:hypothetical protein
MIDNPAQVERLIPKLRAILPLTAGLTPQLATIVRERLPQSDLPPECRVTAIAYAGEEGGIMCKLQLGNDGEHVFYVSVTQLVFRRRHPLAREIAAYQKHRSKRLHILDGFLPSSRTPQVLTRTSA